MNVEFETTVKGGLPVIARVYVDCDEAYVDGVFWGSKPYKALTEKAFASIPKADIERMVEEGITQWDASR